MDMALSPLQSSACRGGALWMGPLQVRIDSNQVMLLFGFAAVDCGRDESQVKSSQNQCVRSDRSASGSLQAKLALSESKVDSNQVNFFVC